jgi:catechol 2,3-dioxygenase-like lactoylglutathione lyase family enzyme
MTVPRLTGVVETSLYVGDLDASETFYRDVFGFEAFLRDERMRALGVAPGQVLLLFRRGGSTQPSPVPPSVIGSGFIPPHDAQGRQHLCFSAPPSALEAWAAHLAQRGVAIESRLTWPNGGTSLYFRDPDDHSLEVATPGLWPNF